MVVVISYLKFLMTAEGNHVGYLVIILSALILGGSIVGLLGLVKDESWKALSVKVKRYAIMSLCASACLVSIICYNVCANGLEDAEIIKFVNGKIDSGYSVRVDQGGRYVYDMTNEKKCDISDLEYFDINIDDNLKQVEFKIKPNRVNWK